MAKYWAAEGGQRVVHAASHLHGGVGVDRDYPLHRYFLLTRQIELTLGGRTRALGAWGESWPTSRSERLLRATWEGGANHGVSPGPKDRVSARAL